MTKYFIFTTFLLLALAFSCSGQYSSMKAELDSINALAEVNADSAARLLEKMREDMKDAPSELVAYYDLIDVKTNDKRHIRHTSDTLISKVVKYYEKQDEDGHLPEAYYYVGRANSDMNNSEKALFYFFKALQCDSNLVTVHLKSRIYAQTGYIYLRNCLFEDAKNMQEMAYFYCKEEGDTLGMRYSKEDIATISMLEDSVAVDSAQTKAILLKIMQIKEKVKADKLAKINSDLQERIVSNKDRTLFAGALVTLFIILAVFVFVKMKLRGKSNEPQSATSIAQAAATENSTSKQEQRQEPAPVEQSPATTECPSPVRKQFYDREVNELITSRVNSDKVLKAADWRLIEERLTESFPTFKDDLYSHINLSETEYRICILIKLEVSPSNMAKLLALSNSSVSQIRLRLQHKVFNGEGTAKDWDNYVLSL